MRRITQNHDWIPEVDLDPAESKDALVAGGHFRS
jgi:hypothetical protein